MQTPGFVAGPIANVFTAFNENGEFDPDGQRSLLDYLISLNACSALFVRSGMGQMYTYTYDEVKTMAQIAVDHTAGRLPVIVGAAGVWQRDLDNRADRDRYTQESIELSQYAESIGADGVVLVLPEALAPGAGETIHDLTLRYCDAVHEATTGPIFLYQPPPISEPYRFTPILLREIAERPRIVAAKVSTTDFMYLFELQRAVRGNAQFKLIAGSECIYYGALTIGIDAVIGQGCCVNPAILKAELEAYRAGDFDRAMDAQAAVNELVVESGPHAVDFLKRYATELGFPVGPHARQEKQGAYGTVTSPRMTDGEYQTYRTLLETRLEEFGSPTPAAS